MVLLKTNCSDELGTRLYVPTLVKYVILIGLEGVPVVDIPVVPCHVETQALILIAPTVQALTLLLTETHMYNTTWSTFTVILIKLI